MAKAVTQFILYACPEGPLAQQVDTYMAHAAALYGPNTAHQYMPHCTLTGFFEDEPATALVYVEVLEQLLSDLNSYRSEPLVAIKALSFQPDWHGLELNAPWLNRLAEQFRNRAESPSRWSSIRPKSWLHLSLAYGFAPEHDSPLRQLAHTHIDAASPVTWALRFYERRLGNHWFCHRMWPLSFHSLSP